MPTSKRKRLQLLFTEILQPTLNDPVTTDALVERLLTAVFPSRNISEQQAMVGALSWVMDRNPILNAPRLGAFASTLLDQGYTPEQIYQWYSLMREEPAGSSRYITVDSPWRKDWRSKGGKQYPNQRDMEETLQTFQRMATAADSTTVLVMDT